MNDYDINGLYNEFKSIIEQVDNSIERIRNEKDWEYSHSTDHDAYIKETFDKADFVSCYTTYQSAKQELTKIIKQFNSNIKLKDFSKIEL